MKQLVKEDYNYFQLEGIDKEKSAVIKNCFEMGIAISQIAKFVNLSLNEVELRIKEMKLIRPIRARKGANSTN